MQSLWYNQSPPFLFIGGPCQIESLAHCLKIGAALKEISEHLKFTYVFKASFDKANRTSLSSERGPGLESGLEILAEVRKQLAVPVITDIHLPQHAAQAARFVDILQIPAFLCRQTDLLLAAGATGLPIQVKKGQFLAPEDMRFVLEKITSTGNAQILLCERGTCFGYRDLIVDLRSLVIMRSLGAPVVFDGTHSVQQIGGASGVSGGSRSFVPALCRAAAAVGIDGLFLEVHDDPDSAPSDGPNMIPLEEASALLSSIARIRQCTTSQES